ncbi:tumor necrosis factor alpha-induced protein 2-like isoform X2 [Hyla sarda]|uniref:tumor necrosis factor alpha-induced protein 2-like isoform X2 n=1 Tax=Hyla sarda TaxID=327740 RepID=UPI0024C34D88|nr:tumor necrosis factor alpha-induced protein 2-like isoform X2 [Hyla sarda]XP_056401439.1 tumor necrosis factor alpha-induced protein 2-like isoform X2 [Hyla sarda]
MLRWKKAPRDQEKINKEEENNPDGQKSFFGWRKAKMKRLKNGTSDQNEIYKEEENDSDDKNEQNRNINEKDKKKGMKFDKYMWWKGNIQQDYQNSHYHYYIVFLFFFTSGKKKSDRNETPSLLTTDHPGKKKSHSNETPPDHSVVEEHDEPIEEKKTLLKETKELMALELNIYIGGSIDNDMTNEIESLYKDLEERVYKDLEERVSRVIIDSISKMDEVQLKDAIQAILEQDRVRRPSQQSWKTKWIEWVALSVTKGMNRLPGSRLAQVLGTIGKAMKKDLIHVIENLEPLYPREFDVCNTYAQQYLRVLQYEINLVTDYELSEIHLLLVWTKTLYPRILGDPALADHINMAQMGELLPPEKISHLENMYIHQLKENLKELMTNALETRNWKRERQPVMTDLTLYSELYIDIIQICESGIKPAWEISEDLVNKVTPIMVNEFLEFLHRYENFFTIFVKNRTRNIFKEIVTVNMYCCYQFRVFTEVTRTDEDTKQQINSVLTKIKKEGYSILLQDLFQGIKSDFRRISQTRGLNSENIMSQIITTAMTYMSNITTLEASCRQVMAGEVHKHLVKEYLTKIIDIRHHNREQQKDLADEMHNTANLLTTFCTDQLNDAQVPEAEWMNNAIHRIAEIIRLQDVEAIKLEVGMLANEYPDISQRHVIAFLYIKGNLNISALNSIVNALENSIRRDDPERRLFTFIPSYSSNSAVCVQMRKTPAQITECCRCSCCS